MSDELKRLEIELAKVRLAKEQIELREAVERVQRKQRLADSADKIIEVGRAAAQGSAAAIAQRTPTASVAWSKILTFGALAFLLFIVYVAGLPESKSNALLVAFIISAAFGLYAAALLLKKLLQLVFHRT